MDFLTWLNDAVNTVNGYLADYVLVILLVGVGLWFTIRTRFVQVRYLGEGMKNMFGGLSLKGKEQKSGMSSFQALATAVAAQVGTGNIVGVTGAIIAGGPGAVFWMWLIAFVGGASAFVESTLAQIYKKKGPDGCYGGPAYYIQTALKNKPLAIIFSIFLILTYGFGFNMLASYNLQSTFSSYSFYNPTTTPWIIGIILAVICGYCLIGGGKRIISVTSFLVPFMGCAYILASLVIVVINFKMLPDVFRTIFTGFASGNITFSTVRRPF